MAVAGYTGGRFIFVSAYNNQVNLYPGTYLLGEEDLRPAGIKWENINNAFSQDLSNTASYNEFNQDNSAYLIVSDNGFIEPAAGSGQDSKPADATNIEPEAGPTIINHETEVEYVEEGEAIENDSQDEDAADKQSDELDIEAGAAEEPAIDLPNTEPPASKSQTNSEPVAAPTEPSEPEPVMESTPDPAVAPSNEPEPTTEISEDSVSLINKAYNGFKSIVSGQSDNIFDLKLAQAAVDTATTAALINSDDGLLKQSLVFLDFSVPLNYQENGIGTILLKLSLAGASQIDKDSIMVEYTIGEDWTSLGQIDLAKEITNAGNGDYWQFALPNELSWDDLPDLKIKVSYAVEAGDITSINKKAEVYLDSLWLEVSYNKEGGEEIVSKMEIGEVLGAEEEVSEIEEEEAEKSVKLTMLAGKENYKFNEPVGYIFQYQRIRKNLIEKIGAGILNIFRDEYKKLNIEASILDINNRRIYKKQTKVNYLGEGEFSIDITAPERQFKPGKFSLEIKIKDKDQVYTQVQDFYWGVLAFNVNKSIYNSGEQAYLQLGVLDDRGHTLCGADLLLEIIAPDSGTAELSTANGLITRNPECAGDTVIPDPDYYGSYRVGEPGTYIVKVQAETANGVREIMDQFEVREQMPFEIERIGPTRIFPLELYEMRLRVKANENYSGELIEKVPASFKVISNANDANEMRIQRIARLAFGEPRRTNDANNKEEGEQILTWPVDWQAGNEYTYEYTFDAPDESPQFYLLGPAEIYDANMRINANDANREYANDNPVFVEARQWQIAGDATGEYYATDGYYGGTWTTPDNAWNAPPDDDQYAIRNIANKSANEENTHYLIATSSNAVDLGYSIDEVWIGVEGYVEDDSDVTVRMRPIFDGTDNGGLYEISGPNMGETDDDYPDFVEITNDGAGPGAGGWDWDDILNLHIRVWGLNSDNGRARNMYIDQIYIQVEYATPNDAATSSITTAVQKGNGTGAADVEIEIDDNDDDEIQVRVEYEAGAGCGFATANKATIDETDANTTADHEDPDVENDNYYQIGNAAGYIITASGSNSVHFDWLSATDAPTGDGIYCLRIWANDTQATSTAATTTLTIDNVAPTAPGDLSLATTTGTTATINFGATTTETNFVEYKIYYKQADGSDPSEGDSLLWASSTDENLGNILFYGFASTTITDLFPSTQYIFNIWAYDEYGRKASATNPVYATTSAQFVPPVGTINSIAQKKDGSGIVEVSLQIDDGNDDDVRVRMDYVAGTGCNFGVPLDPVLDAASISSDYGTPAIDNGHDYQIGTTSSMIPTNAGANNVYFDWLSRSHVPVLDGDYCVQFTANDLASGDDLTPATTTLTIDNTDPSAAGQLSVATTTDRTVTLSFGASTTEAHFSHYKIFYKIGSVGVTEDDYEFGTTSDANLDFQDYNTATSTTISGLLPLTKYVFNIWAYDQYGNKTSSTEITATTKEAEPIRVNTVMFPAGIYYGDTGKNSDATNTLTAFNFRLAEGSAEIRNAFIVFEAQFEAYANNPGPYTGYNLAFDACVEACAADAFDGSGRVLKDDNTVLVYDEEESNQVRLLLDVTDEVQLAAYSGNNIELEGQVGYRIERGTPVNSIANAKAVLIITYTYNENDTTDITNTVIYPLDSTAAGDSGTRRSSQADDCTPGAPAVDCPTFEYNMEIPEFGVKITDWFKTYLAVDRNGGLGLNYDSIVANVNIEGTDFNSSSFIYELDNGVTQSHPPAMLFQSVPGFSENSASTLEYHPYCTGDAANFYLLGGEVMETYIASSSASVKTRTVSFPIGVINNGLTQAKTNNSVDVYFPENGAGAGIVDVKKAWIRLVSSNHTGAGNITVSTQVGSNPESNNWAYSYDTDTSVAKPSFNIIHIIPSGDYSQLEAANASSSKTVVVYTTNNNNNQGGISGELMITYTYSDETSGYLADVKLFAGQTDTNANDQLENETAANSVLPEVTGTKTMLAGALLASFLFCDSDGDVPAAATTYDADISTATPNCSNAYNSRADDSNMFTEFYSGVTSALNTTDNQAYTACYSNNGGGSATAGAKMNGMLIYTYSWEAPPPIYEQNDWRWYENINLIQPTTAKAAENTAVSGINLADILRVRINVGVTSRALATSSQNFILQFGEGSNCAAISEWHNVGATTSSEIWRFYDNSGAGSGNPATSTLLASSTVVETYEEANPSALNASAIPVGGYGEWDWVIYNNSATATTPYCFRMVLGDDTAFNSYNPDGYPKLTTAASNTAPANPSALGQYRDDGLTVINNTNWIDEDSVRLTAAATDVNINEMLYLYYEVLPITSGFTTATSAPNNPCLSGTAYGACGTHIWVATSTVGDYRADAFIATTSITAIPDADSDYKWQVLACDDGTKCSDWTQFAAPPNFRVDVTDPTAPGGLQLSASSATSILLEFGASTTEANFYRYRIFYKAGTERITEGSNGESEHNDSDLNEINYDDTTTTLVEDLAAGTVYSFEIWAYDYAGNKASSTFPLTATTASSWTEPTGSIDTISQKTDGSGRIDIRILVNDADNDDTLRARLFYEQRDNCDAFTVFNDPTIDDNDAYVEALHGDPAVDNNYLYQVGTSSPPGSWIITSPGANFVWFDWLSKIDEPAANASYCVGLVVNDGNKDQIATASALLIIDNVPPNAPSPLTLNSKNSTSLTVNLAGGSTDPRFDRYRIFYSTASPVTINDDEHTAYFGATSTNFYNIATTTITGLAENTLYYLNIWAFDTRGNNASATPMLATTTNALPDNATAINQYRSDEATVIPNARWINENEVRLVASATDSDTSELLTLYFEFKLSSGSFTTATSQPSGACVYGTAYGGACGSSIWYVAAGSPGDYSVNPYIGTTSITAIPDSATGYKWQVLACDDDGDCANNWTQFNAITPNVKVDILDPQSPGPVTEYVKSSRWVILSFGAETVEDNFSDYKIYYATTSPVTDTDFVHASTTDSNLGEKDYGGAGTTTITGLLPDTTYYFIVYAYDKAGNFATSSEASVTTNAVVSTPGVLFYTKNTRAVFYKTWDGTSWSTEQSSGNITTAGDNIRHLRSVRSDDGSRVGLLIKSWDGTNQMWWGAVYRAAANDFVGTSTLGAAEADATNNQLITGCIGALSGGEFMVVRNNNAANGTLVFSWNATDGWSEEGAGPNPGAVVNGCQLVRRPNTDNYLLLTFDDTQDGGDRGNVGSSYYYGGDTYADSWTNWTEHSLREEDRDNYVGEAFFDPSDNTRGAINYSNSNSTGDTRMLKFSCNDGGINYAGSDQTSPITWGNNFVHGEWAADPGGTGVAFYAGDDVDGDVNVFKVNISTSTPSWFTTVNGDNISATGLYDEANDAQKPYAISFYKSGYGVVAWNSAAAGTPYYRVIDAAANSVSASNQSVPDAVSDIYSRVRFYNDPNEYEFIALYQNDSDDFATVFWDGENERFYSTTTDLGSEQVWTLQATSTGVADYDHECTSFAFTAGNATPNTPYSLGQYKSDGLTAIANEDWTDESTVKFKAAVKDGDTSEVISLYLQLITDNGDLATTSGVPFNACTSTAPFTGCNSKIWLVATSTAGDYSVNPFIATATITAIPESGELGYKWQYKACDDENACSGWVKFNVTTPNFKVDYTDPSAPGQLEFGGKNSTSITLNFGASTTEDNFSHYKIYYSTTSPPKITDNEHTDPDLNYQDYQDTTNTVVLSLKPDTLHYFNIWAYDKAGNSASSTFISTTTNTTYYLRQVSYLMENDDGNDVNRNSADVLMDTALTGVKIGERIIARLQVENIGGDTASDIQYKLQYENQTLSPGSWNDVGAATPISYSYGLSGDPADPINPSKTAFNTNTWTYGQWQEDTSVTTAFDLDNGKYTEFAFAIETSRAATNTTYRLRLYNETDSKPLDGYTSTATIATIAVDEIRYGKDIVDSLDIDSGDLDYYLDHQGYSAIESDDNSRDAATSSSKIPVFNFVISTTTNTQAMTATWNGQSTAPATVNQIKLQVFRFGTVNEWENVATNSMAVANNDFNLSANINSSLSEYYDSDNLTYWRVFQESGSQALKSDYFHILFTAPVAETRQLHYRWREDNGEENDANWLEDEDTGSPTASTSVDKGENVRIRFAVANDGGGSAANYRYLIEYASSTSDCSSDPGGWEAMPTDYSGHWRMGSSTYFGNGSTTTDQLTGGSYNFISGYMVEDPLATTSPVTLAEDDYTEVEYVIQATANALAAGTYCFRATNNSTALDNYDIYGLLTLAGVTNVAPYFTTDPSDNTSASTSPTDYGDDVDFSATAVDTDAGDQYYFAVCQTDSITPGLDGPPTCDDDAWCISPLATSTEEAYCSYTTATSSELLDWYGFVCDKHPGFSVAKCSTSSQGIGALEDRSPFAVNHPPVLTSVSTTLDNRDPGQSFTITTVSYDNDSAGGQDTLTLYVCRSNGATELGCNVPADEVCSAVATSSPDAKCYYQDVKPTPAGNYTYYAFIFDNHDVAAAGNSQTNTYTINNVDPVLGETILNNGAPITLNIRGAPYKQVSVVNTSVVDENGCDTLVSATARIYMSATTSSCVQNDNTCYQATTSSCVKSACDDDDDSIATYTCTVGLKYFANPTVTSSNNPYWAYNWISTLNVYDGVTYVASTSPGVEININYALDVADTEIDFGDEMIVGENSGTDNASTTVINAGNCPIDTDLMGSDMDGTPSGEIAVNNIKFCLEENFDYTATGTTLSVGGKPALMITPKPTSESVDIFDEIYWGIGIPIDADASTYIGSTTYSVFIDTDNWPE